MAIPSSLWRELGKAGVGVREFNRFSLVAPLEVALRDHRKSLSVDGRYASVGGSALPTSGRSAPRDRPALPRHGHRRPGPVWRTSSEPSGRYVGDAVPSFPSPSGSRLRRSPRPVRTGRAWSCRSPVGCASRACSRSSRPGPGSASGSRTPTSWHAQPGPDVCGARDGVDVRLLLPATNDVPLVSTVSRAGTGGCSSPA